MSKAANHLDPKRRGFKENRLGRVELRTLGGDEAQDTKAIIWKVCLTCPAPDVYLISFIAIKPLLGLRMYMYMVSPDLIFPISFEYSSTLSTSS